MNDAPYQGMLFEPVQLDLRTVPPEILEEVRRKLETESFVNRMRDMFKQTNEHKMKYEVTMLNVMFFSSFAVGHYIEMRRSVGQELDNFKRTNQLTIYKSNLEASRKAFDVTLMRSMLRATRSGFRLSAYVTSVMCGTFMIQAARNQSSWYDLALAYAIVSGITKMHRGPSGMIVAGSIGGLLGMMVSVPFCLYQRFTQATYPERRQRVAAYELLAYRNAEAREREGETIFAIDAKLYEAEQKEKSMELDFTPIYKLFDSIRNSLRALAGSTTTSKVDDSTTK